MRYIVLLILTIIPFSLQAQDTEVAKQKIVNKFTNGVSLAFGTTLAAFAREYADGYCFMDFYYPQSTTSISE